MPPKTPRTIRAAKPKKPQDKVPVNIQRLSEERLVDSKILREKPSRLSYIVGIAAIAGIAVGGGILYYLYNSETPWDPYERPEIILPEEQDLIDELDDIGNPTSTPTTTPVEESPPAVTFQQVVILDTPTGFLNVRSGAGTNFAKLTEVNPGEVYDFVAENAGNGGWYQIKLSDGSTGWVTRQYARIK